MRQAALAIMQAIPHPLAKVCREAILSNDLNRLPDVNPGDFTSPYAYLEATQVVSCVKKLKGLIPNQDDVLTRKAEETFLECERQCAETNQRLVRLVSICEGHSVCEDENDVRLISYVEKVQDIIKTILGPLPKTLGKPVFSDGSSFLNRANRKTLPHKLGGVSAVTPQLHEILHLLEAQNAPRWTALRARYGTEVVEGNRFIPVDKDSRKKRGICVEPLCNVAWQLTVGNVYRQRLRNAGVVDISWTDTKSTIQYDFRSEKSENGAVSFKAIPRQEVGRKGFYERFGGQSLHQYLAYVGSLEGDLATGDQSNASDTVAYQLVKLAFLKCKGWFDLMCTLRSPKTSFRGEWVNLEKFSSMGNGFTFELETLLFYSLVKALKPDGLVSVYGDDLIYESEISNDVAACLRYFGFTMNLKKSYSTGSFRESCGGDFFNGVPVRPITPKGAPASPTEWFTLLNQFSRINSIHQWGLEPLLAEIARTEVPKWALFYGPPTRDACERWIETDDRSLWRTRNADKDGELGYTQVRGLDPEYGKRYKGWRKRDEAVWCALLGTPSTGAVVGEPTAFRARWFAAP